MERWESSVREEEERAWGGVGGGGRKGEGSRAGDEARAPRDHMSHLRRFVPGRGVCLGVGEGLRQRWRGQCRGPCCG